MNHLKHLREACQNLRYMGGTKVQMGGNITILEWWGQGSMGGQGLDGGGGYHNSPNIFKTISMAPSWLNFGK